MTTPAPRLLVVDDNPADVELIRIAFELADIAVEINSCLDGIEALALLQNQKITGSLPTLLLLDLNMPRLNGFEILSFLQRQGLLEQLSVVVLSTSAQAEDRKRCLSLGAREMFTKPESINDLRQLVNLLLPYLSLPIIDNQAS
jgi:CheY-like chemotaxis protein